MGTCTCDLGTWYKSSTKGKKYRLSYSTISQLAAFDLLNMLLKHDEKLFLYDQLDIQKYLHLA